MWLLVHGFGTRDGGVEVFEELMRYFDKQNIEYKLVSYDFNFTLDTSKAVEAITKVATPGCKIIAHSNGCTASYECALLHSLWIRHLIMVAPPLTPNLTLPMTIDHVDICWNEGDLVVELAGFWRAMNDMVLKRDRIVALFGPMGRRGPIRASSRVRDYKFTRDTGHSGYFRQPKLKQLIKLIN